MYIKSFGGQKGGSLEPPRTPPAYGPGLHKSSAAQHAQCTNLVLQLSNNLTDIEQHYVDLVRCEQHETALKVKECVQHYCEGEDQGQFNHCSG